MMTNLYKITAALVLATTLSACAAPMDAALPDDPDNEPVAVNQVVDESSFYSAKDAENEVEFSTYAETTASEAEQILKKYSHLDPKRVVPTKHLANALIYFDNNKSKFANQNVISVIDFSKRSSEKRWHFIDMKTGEVWSLHVAHGKGSDSNGDGYAEKFSNVSGSNASSLGFYRTAETYSGKWGYSLRIDGLSSTNSNARRRAVVVHGADYVVDRNVTQGRTWGCPAVSMANRTKVINLVKGGSLIYAVQ